MSQPDPTDRAAELLERLLTDPEFRARFRRDPATASAEYGITDVPTELEAAPRSFQTLEIRESRSSLAGAFMAAAAEGVDVVHAVRGLHEQGWFSGDAARAVDRALTSSKLKAVVSSAHGHDIESVSQVDPGATGSSAHPQTGVVRALVGESGSAGSRSHTVQFLSAVHHDPAPAGDQTASSLGDGYAPDPGDQYPGDGAPQEAIAAWMARQAHRAGLPGELPVMAALTESGLRNLPGGDADSVGFFQMRTSVWDKGEYAGYANDPELQLKWFIEHALAVRANHVAAGDAAFGRDSNAWGEWIADVENPAAQFRGRYQEHFDQAHALLTTGGGDAQAPAAGLEGLPLGGEDLASPRAVAALSIAAKYLGTPYQWGGETPDTGFDCSGIAHYAYGQVGVHLPRVAADQFNVGVPVAREQLQPGDLVFFRDSKGYIHHEGIYIGDDKFLHAPHTGDVVKISSLDQSYYAGQFAGGRRVAELAGAGSPVPAVTPPPALGDVAAADPVAPGQSGPGSGSGSGFFRSLPADPAGKPVSSRNTVKFLRAISDDQPESRPDPGPAMEQPHVPPVELPVDPDADAAARHLSEFHYGFVRDSLNAPDYAQLKAAGYNGVLLHANDPHLAEAMETARAAGIQSVGIWAPANEEDPVTFAHRLADLEKYKPSIVLPDIEIEGKGVPGSPQWQWSEDFAKLYRQLAPHQVWGVTVMADQDDFNYGAYTGRGASVWPQTYGATYDTSYDPRGVVEWLMRDGVDPRLINPVLAPNQSGEGLNRYASYALDDFHNEFPDFLPRPAASPLR